MPGRMTLPPVITNNVNDLPAKITFPAKMRGGCAYLNSLRSDFFCYP